MNKYRRHFLRNTFVFIPILLSCFSLIGCDPTATIFAKVTNESTGMPIEGVKTVFSLTDQNKPVEYTNSEGIAFLSWSGGPRDVPITFSKQGYQDKSVIVKNSDFVGNPWAFSRANLEVKMTP
jgi:hypothetical protein